ncbi:unnamed protein product [Moneuplotes crassus]|uniref:Uncharacterized protein n=1 Tax=Euplotes crassus TaxID=5936 RepID=A0AAD2D170_EUPCR|nr:unnamed protein product [Moneuplotes crassus]
MRNLVFKLVIISLILGLVVPKFGVLKRFRKDPDLNLEKTQKKADKNLRMLLVMLQSFRLIMEGFQDYSLPIQEMLSFSNLAIGIVLRLFNCETLSCITPELVMQKLFYEFRNFAREVISESEYGYYMLFYSYARKELGVISKIISTKGFDEFTQNSNCTRMRIAQYFMPTFVGNDTSNCSQFDDIIISFSEQPIDPSLDLKPLLVKLTIIMILLILNFVAFKLLAREFKIFENQHQHLQTRQLKLTPSKECISEASSLHQELLTMHIPPLKYPQIIEESDESCSFDSEPYSSLTSGARVRGSSAFILSDVASKGK